MEISNVTIMRLTRDAEVEVDDDSAADFRALVKEQIRQRRYEPVVRLGVWPRRRPGDYGDAARTL